MYRILTVVLFGLIAAGAYGGDDASAAKPKTPPDAVLLAKPIVLKHAPLS